MELSELSDIVINTESARPKVGEQLLTVEVRNAIISGNVDDFDRFLRHYDNDHNFVFANGHSLVHLIINHCVSENWCKLVELLLKRGVNVDTRDKRSISLLSKLVIAGDEQLLRVATGQGADIEITGLNGETPLLTAVHYKQVGCLRALLEAGASVNTVAVDGNSPLMWAAGRSNGIGMQQSLLCLKLLLKHGAEVNFSNKRGYTPLMAASLIGETDVVKCLLQNGAATHTADNSEETALHKAVYAGVEDIVTTLLKFGANTEARDKYGCTPLLHATSVTITEKLLVAGANVNAVNKSGNTVAHLCAERNDTECIQLLLDFGAIIDRQNVTGDTPLLIALRNRSYDVTAYLLDLGANVTVVNSHNVGSVHEALVPSNFFGTADIFTAIGTPGLLAEFHSYSLRHSEWYLKTTSDLVWRGVDVNTHTNDGTTPLMFAALMGSSALVTFLLQHGACPLATDSNDRSVLCYAAKSGRLSVVRALLSAGSHPNHQDKSGNLPIVYAAYFRYSDICELLMLDFAFFYVYNCMKVHD